MEALTKLLPSSVLEATQQDRIYRLTTSTNGGNPFENFNRIFDLLFKEDDDCRDSNGRFHYLRRGKYGMNKLLSYLKNVPWSDESMAQAYDLVKLKLDRVIGELDYLTYVYQK